MNETNDRLLTVIEVAERTGLSTDAVYRAVWEGELRASKLRRRLRIRSSDIEAWIAANRVQGRRARPQLPPTRRTPPSERGLRPLLPTR